MRTVKLETLVSGNFDKFDESDLLKCNQSIYPNKCLFYEDIKQFAKVYFLNVVAVRIRQSFSYPKLPVLR